MVMATYHPHVISVFLIELILNAITIRVNQGLEGKRSQTWETVSIF